MDTIVKEKIDSFFSPVVSSLFFSSLEHNIPLIKKDPDIKQFCNRELCQSILYINKAKNNFRKLFFFLKKVFDRIYPIIIPQPACIVLEDQALD